MTTLARKLQSRNHDVVFISWPDGEPSVRAADLTFLPCAVKEFAAAPLKERPRWLKLQGEEVYFPRKNGHRVSVFFSV